MSVPTPYQGHFDGSRHLFAVRVYFEDTDFSGVVYHARYLHFMERARSDMLARVGIDQRGRAGGGPRRLCRHRTATSNIAVPRILTMRWS